MRVEDLSLAAELQGADTMLIAYNWLQGGKYIIIEYPFLSFVRSQYIK